MDIKDLSHEMYKDIHYIDYLFHQNLGDVYRTTIMIIYILIMLAILVLLIFMLKDSKMMID